MIASGGYDRILSVWDTKTRKKVVNAYLKQRLTNVIFSPSGENDDFQGAKGSATKGDDDSDGETEEMQGLGMDDTSMDGEEADGDEEDDMDDEDEGEDDDELEHVPVATKNVEALKAAEEDDDDDDDDDEDEGGEEDGEDDFEEGSDEDVVNEDSIIIQMQKEKEMKKAKKAPPAAAPKKRVQATKSIPKGKKSRR